MTSIERSCLCSYICMGRGRKRIWNCGSAFLLFTAPEWFQHLPVSAQVSHYGTDEPSGRLSRFRVLLCTVRHRQSSITTVTTDTATALNVAALCKISGKPTPRRTSKCGAKAQIVDPSSWPSIHRSVAAAKHGLSFAETTEAPNSDATKNM